MKFYRRFPMHLMLETSSVCNSKCVHCPNGAGLLERQYKGRMPLELAQEIINETAWLKTKHSEFNPHVILYGNGEPLTNKKLPDMIAAGTKAGITTNLSTNMIALKPEHGKIFKEAGLGFIKLSFWGDNKEEYESRCAQKFSRAIDNAMGFLENCTSSLMIDINVVKLRTNPNLAVNQDFLNLFKRFSHLHLCVYSFYGSDWAGQMPCKELSEDFSGLTRCEEPCSHFRDNLMIGYDGVMLSCWLDFNRMHTIGRYRPGNLLELWRDQKRQRVFDLMEQGRFDLLEPCKTCSAPYTELDKARYYYELKPHGDYEARVLYAHVYHYQDFLNNKELPAYVMRQCQRQHESKVELV
jgi:radical SAM protein with 4Fe4S-binding SPASM domain